MKNLYRIISFCFAVILLSIITNSCSEKTGGTSGAIEGLFYYYEDAETGKIRVLDIDSEIRRSITIDEDYTFDDLAQDREELVLKAYEALSISPSKPNGKFLKPKTFENLWLTASNSISPVGLLFGDDDEWFDINMDDESFSAFIFHKVGEGDGDGEYAIESMYYPGRYISHTGHPIQGTNTIFLVESSSVNLAPKWRIHNPSGTFLEGNIELFGL